MPHTGVFSLNTPTVRFYHVQSCPWTRRELLDWNVHRMSIYHITGITVNMWISSRHSRTAEAKPISRSYTFSSFGILLIFSIDSEHIARINAHAQPPYRPGTDTNTFWHVTQRKLFDNTAFLHDRTQNSRGGPISHPLRFFWGIIRCLGTVAVSAKSIDEWHCFAFCPVVLQYLNPLCIHHTSWTRFAHDWANLQISHGTRLPDKRHTAGGRKYQFEQLKRETCVVLPRQAIDYKRVFPKIRVPQKGWFISNGNPSKTDDFGVPPI